jgi:fermentation-respiration switch protein FrsA (DUF1100 family)
MAMTANAEGLSGSWNGKLNVGQEQLTIIFNIGTDNAGKETCTMGCVEQGAKDIPTVINALTADSMNVTVTQLGVNYVGKLKNGVIEGKFYQNGMTLDLNLTPGGEPKLNRPQTPQPPYPYKTEEVTFNNAADGATLAGTLTYPTNWEKADKKNVPIIVLVTGSGQENRDEELFQHKPFAVIADYLARNGIASLRYDDRGTGKSTGEVKNLTTLINMNDAIEGLKYVRGLKRFGKVGLLGHSEGGTIAFMTAARGKADFIVSMAGAGVNGDSIIVEQTRTGCKVQGVPESVAEAAIAQARNTDNTWLKYFMKMDPSADIAKSHCPVMAINGDKDVQVSSKTNLSAIKRLLPENKKNLIKEYPGLNHLFQHCTTGSPTEYINIEETISPEVLSDIATWIKSL